jgi:hypothetical protein
MVIGFFVTWLLSIFFMHDFFLMHDFRSCTSVLMFFLSHILFCSYISVWPKWATISITHLRSLTAMLKRSWRAQFLCSHSGEQSVLWRRPSPKKMKKLGSSAIYLTEEQYRQVKNPKSFDIQHLWLKVIWCIGSIFVQLWILWFRNHEQDYFEFCKLWF